jgi:hypothetical protein
VTWADPAGDAYAQDSPAGQPNDATLDITGVTYTVKKGVFTAKIAVPKFAARSADSEGSGYDADFTIGAHTVDVFGIHGNENAVFTAATIAMQGIKVDGNYVSGTSKVVKMWAASNVVNLSVSVADLTAAVGAPVAGATATKVDAFSSGDYVAVYEPFDLAPAAEALSFVFTDCK